MYFFKYVIYLFVYLISVLSPETFWRTLVCFSRNISCTLIISSKLSTPGFVFFPPHYYYYYYGPYRSMGKIVKLFSLFFFLSVGCLVLNLTEPFLCPSCPRGTVANFLPYLLQPAFCRPRCMSSETPQCSIKRVQPLGNILHSLYFSNKKQSPVGMNRKGDYETQ